ncbi:MAG: hypothetical protein K9L59_19080 [Desulfobacterales bacterium]|nr:hypothetical protein [Desulfobacterales bacterium]MCF8080609.1 hypothetical protein [Desulfobacterales bacterium]
MPDSISLPRTRSGGIHKYLETLDSRFRGNDRKREIRAFYEGIKAEGDTKGLVSLESRLCNLNVFAQLQPCFLPDTAPTPYDFLPADFTIILIFHQS